MIKVKINNITKIDLFNKTKSLINGKIFLNRFSAFLVLIPTIIGIMKNALAGIRINLRIRHLLFILEATRLIGLRQLGRRVLRYETVHPCRLVFRLTVYLPVQAVHGKTFVKVLIGRTRTVQKGLILKQEMRSLSLKQIIEAARFPSKTKQK